MLCEIVATDNPKGNAYLVGVVNELEQVAQQRGVVAAREPPPLGPLDGVQVLAREPRARQAQPRSAASFAASTARSAVSRAATAASARRFSHGTRYPCASASNAAPCAPAASSAHSAAVSLRRARQLEIDQHPAR
jgi:hypothetical protein